jgi:hypothetical protein
MPHERQQRTVTQTVETDVSNGPLQPSLTGNSPISRRNLANTLMGVPLGTIQPPSRPADGGRCSGGRFGAGNRIAVGRGSIDVTSANPCARLSREARWIYGKLKRGELESHIANALVGNLKFQLELMDRFGIEEQFAAYEGQIAQLEASLQALIVATRSNSRAT